MGHEIFLISDTHFSHANILGFKSNVTGRPMRPFASVEEMDAFLADPAPDAYENVVEKLLKSPHYGERWGRHWLDAARYDPIVDAPEE